jgi:hypothetical protein
MQTVPGLFHRPEGLTQAERGMNIKEFTGDGSPGLRVKGLKEVHSVQIGRIQVPIERDYKFPHNADFAQKVQITLPHVMIVEGPDGEALLMRSVHSNDGVWQKGEKIYVGGVWEADAPEAPGAEGESSPTPRRRRAASSEADATESSGAEQ